jgi:anti-sigma factor RsiW
VYAHEVICPEYHVSEELLDQYALNKLSEAEAAAVEEHILICPNCQDRLTLTDDVIEALRAAAAKQIE